MNSQNVGVFVSRADANIVQVTNATPQILNKLKLLGFLPFGDGILKKNVTSNTEKADVLSRLRDLNIPFSAGREWSPSEVFSYLRDEGLLDGSFNEISWSGPNQFTIEKL
jgi:hypothetical protein